MSRKPKSCRDQMGAFEIKADRLMRMVQEGEADCERIRYLVVFSVVRDCVWKLRAALDFCEAGPESWCPVCVEQADEAKAILERPAPCRSAGSARSAPRGRSPPAVATRRRPVQPPGTGG